MWEDTNEIKARKPPFFDVTFFFPGKRSSEYRGKRCQIFNYILFTFIQNQFKFK